MTGSWFHLMNGRANSASRFIQTGVWVYLLLGAYDGHGTVGDEWPAALAFNITVGDALDGSQGFEMDHANVESEAIWQESPPEVTAHAADASCIAGDKLLHSPYIAPSLRAAQGMVDGLADCLNRRFDTPDGDKSVLHLYAHTLDVRIVNQHRTCMRPDEFHAHKTGFLVVITNMLLSVCMSGVDGDTVGSDCAVMLDGVSQRVWWSAGGGFR